MAAFRPDVKTVTAVNSISIKPTASLLEQVSSQLPGGACNFRELGRGTKSPVCGCKRFWLNATNDTSSHDIAWCFCGHHACFHNAVSQQTQRLSTPSVIASTHVTPPPKPTRQTPEGYVSAGLGIRSDPQPQSRSQSQSINTRVWEALNGFAREQEGGGVYSAGTSQLPSTTAISVNGDAEPQYRVMGPPITIPSTTVTRPGVEDYQGSATEIATPSIAGTPDPQAFVPPISQSTHSPQRLAASQGFLTAQDSGHITQSPRPSAISNHEMLTLLRAHSSRLDQLESLSFSYVPIEEVQDKFETFDGRLLDLEQWRNETEDRLQSLAAERDINDDDLRLSRKRRLLPAEVSSFASDESFDMTAAAHAEAAVLATIATNAEIGPRIEMLENRVMDLEKASLPSFTNPWQVEVVLLPWGRNLRGIWFSSADTMQHSMRASVPDVDEWTGAHSQAKTSFRSSSSDAWTTESIQAWAEDAQDWLSPKACGPSGTVYQRLASRGMIRDVTITATDSRHIMDVLATTFRHVLPSAEKGDTKESRHYQGLRAAFIPLRKVRKSTRLRFLSHAEMTTSATWTASFFESSVFMKVGDGQRRLYITTPQAYLQSDEGGLTWQTIRQFPARDINGDEQAGQVDRNVAIEACWSYNDKLDHIASLHSSFASHMSHAAWSTKSQDSIAEHNEAHGQLTPAWSGRENVHKRTTSLPSSSSAHEQVKEILPKRRVASFETSSAVPLAINTSGETMKRRRISNSPEAERRGVNFTPRWSREPPSPYLSEHAGEGRSQGMSSTRKRGTTPFAYATPHSNNHFTSPMDVVGDGDTERDSEPYKSGDEDEEEWNGMDAVPISPAAESIYQDDESMDEEESNESNMP